jgi:hypothetical protein
MDSTWIEEVKERNEEGQRGAGMHTSAGRGE